MSSSLHHTEYHRRTRILLELLHHCFPDDPDITYILTLDDVLFKASSNPGEDPNFIQREQAQEKSDGDHHDIKEGSRPGGLSSADIRRFNRAPIYTLDAGQAKRLAEEMETVLMSMAEFLHAGYHSKTVGAATLPDDLRTLRDELDGCELETETVRMRIIEAVKELNEAHPRLQGQLIHALETIPGTVNKQRTAEADLQAATIELALMKLAYLRTRASQALYGVTAEWGQGKATDGLIGTMPDALVAVYSKLKTEEKRMANEETELDKQLAAYEQTLMLVDGSGGFSQVIEDWTQVKRGMDECRKDLRRFGWTGT